VITLGFQAGENLSTGSNNIEIGNSGFAAEANTIRIGKRETQTGKVVAARVLTRCSRQACRMHFLVRSRHVCLYSSFASEQ